MTPTSIVAYLVLFAAVGFLFLFVSLLLGRFLRARVPTPEKLQPYECGEPPVGSSFVQFDLRFYVVALVFIIFEVELAFFFPWATVFGKVNELRSPDLTQKALNLKEAVNGKYEALGVPEPELPLPWFQSKESYRPIEASARDLARASMVDIGVFFAILLVGFAYVWYRGDLNWVRATGHPLSVAAERGRQFTQGSQGK